MMDKEQILKWLERDRLHHINMTENLRRDTVQVVAADDEGVLLWMDAADIYMMSAVSPAAALRLAVGVARMESLECHQVECAAALEEKYGLERHMECYMVARLDKKVPEIPEGIAEIRPLGVEWLPFVREHYKNPVPDAYLRGRLEAGVMVGAFREGQLAGFIGEHDEGTIGLLEVVPQYRRLGVGALLECHMIACYIEQGRVPHAQVATSNTVSFAMQRRLGFEVGDKIIVWSGLN